MEQTLINIESKFNNKLTNLIRILCAILIISILIFLLPINLRGSIILLLILIFIILFSSKSSIIVYDDYIEFKESRLLFFLNTSLLIPFDKIENVRYDPLRINFFAMFFRGAGTIDDAKFIFNMKNKEKIKKVLRYSKQDINRLIDILNNKIKILKPSS